MNPVALRRSVARAGASQRRAVRRALTAWVALLAGAAACAEGPTVRVATFNVSLNRPTPGGLVESLAGGNDPQARTVAEIIQRVRPDILFLNEFDYDARGEALRSFRQEYLAVAQGTPGDRSEPIAYGYHFAGPVNTGVASGFDLDNDGVVGESGRGYGNDALGFGEFPGQYGMVVLSRFPIDTAGARTFRRFLWRDMPGAALPVADDGSPWFSDEELAVVRLSSKSHWDVPVRTPGGALRLLASHPTPPVFDGPEDRNGRRNHDEIRFWADYLSEGEGGYVYDDRGRAGGFAGDRFVLVGDLNADPLDGDSFETPIRLLLDHPRVNGNVTPASEGAVEQAAMQGGINARHGGNPAHDTGDFADDGSGPGNLRLDYVLPSTTVAVSGSGVFWPTASEPTFRLVGVYPFPGSDHRMVWVDLSF